MDILKVKQGDQWINIPAIIGQRGIGIQSIVKTGSQGKVDTYTIIYDDSSTSTFTVTNGAIPSFSIGTVQDGATAAATITGTTENPILNLTLPNANVPTAVSELDNDAGYATESYVNTAIANVNTMKIHICAAAEYNSETGVPTIASPDTQTFYLVPGGEGSNLFIEWAYVDNAWERFGSADVDLSNYVQKMDYATSSDAGVVKVGAGLVISDGSLSTNPAASALIKLGNMGSGNPIVPGRQHEATFYGLAKAAGDTTQSSSSNAVGTYTDNAKASIKAMLGIVDGSTGTVDVSGTTPTITAVENTRYVCGEVSTLSFTPPASGISIVRFTSGTTATVLTLPSTVKFPEWFDATTLEADTIYELCITDGVYGAVMSWAL